MYIGIIICNNIYGLATMICVTRDLMTLENYDIGVTAVFQIITPFRNESHITGCFKQPNSNCIGMNITNIRRLNCPLCFAFH